MANEQTLHAITYSPASSDRPELVLDYLAPPRPSELNAASPFIFYVHGGGYLAGDRHTTPPHLYGLAQQCNLPLLSVDYRLSPETSLEGGVQDVKDAWTFVTRGQLAQHLSAKGPNAARFHSQNAIVVGISAGSYYTFKLLLDNAGSEARPLAFLNFYGSVHLDPEQSSEPRHVPHPLLDAPGGFPPLDAFVAHLTDVEHSEEGKTSKWTVKPPVHPNKVSTGSTLSLLEALKNLGFISNAQEFRDELWTANGLTQCLYDDSKAEASMTVPDDTGVLPLCRVLLLIWAIRTGQLLTLLNGPNASPAGAAAERRLLNVAATHPKLDASTFPPTLTVHGTADILVPYALSEALTGTLASKQIPAQLVTCPEEPHGMDAKWIVGKYEHVGKVGGGGDAQKHVEEWIKERCASIGVGVGATV